MVITVTRQIGSLGDEIAQRLAKELQFGLVTREKLLAEWLPETIGSFERNQIAESPKFYLHQIPGSEETYKDFIGKRFVEYATKHSCVAVGIFSHLFLKDLKDIVRVRTVATEAARIERVQKQYNLSVSDAQNLLARLEKSNKRFVSTIFDSDIADPEQYDLTINTSGLDVDACVRLIIAFTREKMQPQKPEPHTITETAAFKHPAEVEFAKILDMYHIDWMYEPRTFPVEWDAEGNVTLAFSPDFYLTKFDTYIEITTMNQKYVTTKNKKVRKLKELYPDINIKIVYKKDFHSLLQRFGSGF